MRLYLCGMNTERNHRMSEGLIPGAPGAQASRGLREVFRSVQGRCARFARFMASPGRRHLNCRQALAPLRTALWSGCLP